MLRRFWFEFDDSSGSSGLPFGCGVTAEDVTSALHLVAETYCGGRLPPVRTTLEDVDVSELADRLSVLIRPLRLGVPTVRGIWYPNLTGP